MNTEQVARVLDEMGTLLEIRGENPFRCRAYHNAAQTLRGMPSDLSEALSSGKLAEASGIGSTLFAKIAQLATTGRLAEYDELKRATPPGLVALLRIPGLGPKKIKALRDALSIESLADLRAAAESGKIAPIKGFGAKTETKILEGIAFVESVGDRILLSDAIRLIEPIFAAIHKHPKVIRSEICGSLRRRKETIGDLDILFSSDDPGPVLDDFVKLPQAAQVLAHGSTKASVRLIEGVQCDLRGVRDAEFPFALNYFTGSKEHNIVMRRRAIARGLKLSEYSLEGPDGPLACRTERDIYKALGLAEIPPELREDRGEFDAAEHGKLPHLITRADLTGTFHCHTTYSDGGGSLEEMAEGARSLGFQYLGIADHSKSAGYAGGLSAERVLEQRLEIDKLNQKYNGSFRIFKGTECDILTDGSLDYPDELLAGFDYVTASVHSNFGLSREAMTARIVRAIRHPLVTMLGHPTGRLLLAREGYEIDLDAVIEAAAETGTMIEINANPHRLDLDDVHSRRAKERGVRLVINPDAHEVAGLSDIEFGVYVARRGGLSREDVVNTRSTESIAALFEKIRAEKST